MISKVKNLSRDEAKIFCQIKRDIGRSVSDEPKLNTGKIGILQGGTFYNTLLFGRGVKSAKSRFFLPPLFTKCSAKVAKYNCHCWSSKLAASEAQNF